MNKFVENHVKQMVDLDLTERRGEIEKAEKMRAQAYLRLIVMTDEEIEMLAKKITLADENWGPKRDQILGRIDEIQTTATEWVPKIIPPDDSGVS